MREFGPGRENHQYYRNPEFPAEPNRQIELNYQQNRPTSEEFMNLGNFGYLHVAPEIPPHLQISSFLL